MVVLARSRGRAVVEDGIRVVDLNVIPQTARGNLRCHGAAPEPGPVDARILVWNTWEFEIGTSNRVAAGIEYKS